MKRRPLIIVACIASICFIGICFTLFTQSYIASHSAELARKDLSGRMKITEEYAEAENEAAEELSIAVMELDDILPDEKEQKEPGEVSTEACSDVLLRKTENGEEELTQYLEKLAALEEQIDFSWEALGNEKSKPSVQQEQAVADLAYKIWDDELNTIYKMLRDKLSEEDFSILKKEERLWLKSRDESAESAVLGVSNALVQKLRYTMSLSETTKERTYELVEMYFNEE